MNSFIEINKIRLNEEVNGFLIAHYKGRGKKIWEAFIENEVEDILDFKLKKEVSDMSGHITIIQLNGPWWIFFDFRDKGQENLKKANEYLRTAQDF